jgi:uncharacterized protein (DUF952 family)
MVSEPFFHIVRRADWDPVAKQIVAASVATEGFAHCSYAAHVAESANRHFPPDADLVALELDPARIDAPIKIERAPARGTDFPHVYGPIPVAAVVAAWPIPHSGDSTPGFTFSPGSAGPASDR